MRVVAAVLAAGRGSRFGCDKVAQPLGGKPVWRWAVDAFLAHPEVDEVVLVTAADRMDEMAALIPAGVTLVSGGDTRQASSRAALLAAADAEFLLVHDGARPFVSDRLISDVLAAVRTYGAAAAAVPVTDTIKRVTTEGISTLQRNELVAMQTPQGARTDLLRRAHAVAGGEQTDEMALLEAMGVVPHIVAGEPINFKITTPDDIVRARAHLGRGESRTGFGYDIHSFSTDPSRELWLGGVRFDGHAALEGHSDADVLLHAITDALLGAASLGDIGVHFPNNDPRWSGQRSAYFLTHAVALLAAEEWEVKHIDATVVAETPKVMARAAEIRAAIAEAAGIELSRVSLKATTNERLGSIGRSEGIAAMAVATIVRS